MAHMQTTTLPPAGEWHIDTDASTVSFCGRASRLAPTVRARFTEVHGALHLDDDPNRSRVEVDLDVRSLTTGNPVWDDVLRVADPFHQRMHPIARYASTRVEWDGRAFVVTGTLHVGGTRVAVTLTASITPDGDCVNLAATGSVDPRAAGIKLDVPGGSLLVPRKLELTITVRATRTRYALAG